MDIFKSPFFILGATPQDNRRKLFDLAEEKALLLDSDLVAEARSVLSIPSKRLNAEIRWFPELDLEETTEITDYCMALKLDISANEPALIKSDSLVHLNMKLYSLPFKHFSDLFQLKHAVLEISRLYSDIGVDSLQVEINKDRAAAGLPSIGASGELEDELRGYRSDIRKAVSSQLLSLTLKDYAELITLLAKKYSSANDRYNGQAVLEDIIADYELQIAPEMDAQKKHIVEMISLMEKGATEIRIHDAVSEMIRFVANWDALAQPLQLVAKGRGQMHTASEEVAYSIRALSIELHNSYGETEEAIRLEEALQQFFLQLSDFEETVADDIDTLHRLKNEKEAGETDERDKQESVQRNRMDKRYFITIRAGNAIVPQFCTCCMNPTSSAETVSTSVSQQSGNRKTTRTISMDMPICPECSAHRRKAKNYKWLVALLSAMLTTASVPIISREIDTSNGLFWTMPFVVAVVAYVLLGLIVKLPLLGAEHSTTQQSVWLSGIGMTGDTTTFSFSNWRYAKLFAAANSVSVSESKYRNRAKSRAYLKAIDHPIGIGFFSIALTAAVLISFGSSLVEPVNTPSTTSPAPTTQNPLTSYTSPPTTTKPSTNSTSDMQAKQQELNAIKDEIADMEDQLTALSDEIDYYEEKYYEAYSDTYANLYNDAIDAYHSLWEEYDQSIDDYNDRVNEYNNLLHEAEGA